LSLAAWLRFAELSVLGAWLAWRLYRPRPFWRFEAAVPAGAAILGAAQLGVEARAATDAFTSPWQLLPSLMGTWFGALSLVILLGGLLAAGALPLLYRSSPMASMRLTVGAALALLVAAGASAAGVRSARAAAASGDIAMSPTLIVPRSAMSVANPYASDPGSTERGRLVYQQNCAVCHGINGDGNGPAAANMRIRPASFRNPQHFLAPGMDGAHFWVIEHGDGQPSGMPTWQGKLSEQQMWDALNYVKALASRP